MSRKLLRGTQRYIVFLVIKLFQSEECKCEHKDCDWQYLPDSMGHETSGSRSRYCDALSDKVSKWTLWRDHGSSSLQWWNFEGSAIQNTEIQRSYTFPIWLFSCSTIPCYFGNKVKKILTKPSNKHDSNFQDAKTHVKLPNCCWLSVISSRSGSGQSSSSFLSSSTSSCSVSTSGKTLR